MIKDFRAWTIINSSTFIRFDRSTRALRWGASIATERCCPSRGMLAASSRWPAISPFTGSGGGCNWSHRKLPWGWRRMVLAWLPPADVPSTLLFLLLYLQRRRRNPVLVWIPMKENTSSWAPRSSTGCFQYSSLRSPVYLRVQLHLLPLRSQIHRPFGLK